MQRALDQPVGPVLEPGFEQVSRCLLEQLMLRQPVAGSRVVFELLDPRQFCETFLQEFPCQGMNP